MHLITTQTGRKIAIENLLENGQFRQLLQDYPQLGAPSFDENHVHVICDDEGQPLDDITSDEENTHATNSITRLMADLTSDKASALHVSMSGGRKTMGFYVGYAFSLYARPQDELSHVLVSAPFEGLREFYFPPAKPCLLTTRDGTQISTGNAVITLARIPIVRLRAGIPAKLMNAAANYGDTVAAIQDSFEQPHLFIDLRARQITCGGKPVKLAPFELAWLAWWAKLAKRGHAMKSRLDFCDDRNLRDEFLAIYEMADETRAGQTRKILDTDNWEDLNKFFEQKKSRLNRELKEQLGPAAAHYLIESEGKRGKTRYGLKLAPDQIDLRLG